MRQTTLAVLPLVLLLVLLIGTLVPVGAGLGLRAAPVALAAETPSVSIEPLPELRVGHDPAVTVLARLTLPSGAGVAGARLVLLVDGAAVGSDLTDDAGTARLRLRRELGAGEHRIAVRYEGSKTLAPASAGRALRVLPAEATVVGMSALPTLRVGGDPTVTLNARLATVAGRPLPGARLVLLVDGLPAGSGTTDAAGVAELRFRRELAAGGHQVEVRYEGSAALQAASLSRTLTVLPIEASVVTIVDPLPTLKVGQEPTVGVVARLTTAEGRPVSGARLVVVVDGVPAGSDGTDSDGVATLRFRRELAAGEHQVEVTFEGTRGVAPGAASLPLVVLPADATVLVIDALPTLRVGADPSVTVTARLSLTTGEPVAGGRLTLILDGESQDAASTDGAGVARLRLRREHVAGQHTVVVAFEGARSLAPASVERVLEVLPAEVLVQVVPPLVGVGFLVDGRVFSSGADGTARLELSRIGAYRVEVLPYQPSQPGAAARFARWSDEVFGPVRDVLVPQVTRLQVGFETSYLVGLRYFDPLGGAVQLGRIGSATLTSSVGTRHRLQPGERQWLPGARIVRRANGLEETRILYSVEEVVVEGANVVNAREQRFYLEPELEYPVRLLLYSARFSARDAVFGGAIGSAVRLQHPDGRVERYPLGPDGTLTLSLLPRGEYRVSPEAPGVTYAQPVALSQDQDVELRVISYVDLAGAAVLLASLALGLLLAGRPRLLGAFQIIRPRAALHLLRRRAVE